MCAFRSNKASPSRTGRESLFREASENDPSSRLSLELFRWCRRRRKKLLLAEPDPRLVGPFSSSESCRLRFSDKLLLNTRSSSSLQNIVQKYRYCSIRVELRSWSGYGALFTRLDKYRFYFHTSNCKSVSSPYAFRSRTLN